MRDMTGRVERLEKAIVKVRSQLASKNMDIRFWDHISDKAKVEAREIKNQKLVEFEKSLKNIHLYGEERTPNDKPTSVNIGVPHAGDKT